MGEKGGEGVEDSGGGRGGRGACLHDLGEEFLVDVVLQGGLVVVAVHNLRHLIVILS